MYLNLKIIFLLDSKRLKVIGYFNRLKKEKIRNSTEFFNVPTLPQNF